MGRSANRTARDIPSSAESVSASFTASAVVSKIQRANDLRTLLSPELRVKVE